MVLQITGRQVIDALENGICKYPALEGRCAAGRRGGGRLAMTVHLQQDADFYAQRRLKPELSLSSLRNKRGVLTVA